MRRALVSTAGGGRVPARTGAPSAGARRMGVTTSGSAAAATRSARSCGSTRRKSSATAAVSAAPGSAATRASSCETSPGEYVVVTTGGDVSSEPYIHNHSTFESFFNGYYYA